MNEKVPGHDKKLKLSSERTKPALEMLDQSCLLNLAKAYAERNKKDIIGSINGMTIF